MMNLTPEEINGNSNDKISINVSTKKISGNENGEDNVVYNFEVIIT